MFGYNFGLYESQCLGTPNPPSIYGCTDPNASNYYPAATIDACNCFYPVPVLGCTDPLACNYNSLANVDDGSCITDKYHEYEICSIPHSGQYTTALANLSVGMRINFICDTPPAWMKSMWPLMQYPTMNYTVAMDNCSTNGPSLPPNPGDVVGILNSNDTLMPQYATFPTAVGVGCFKYIGTSCTKAANGGIGIGGSGPVTGGSTSMICTNNQPSCAVCSTAVLSNVCTQNCGQL